MLARPRLVYGRPTYGSPLAPTTMQSSVEQYGITWTFDQEYPVGQFVNGDYFVVGPVTITDIDPSLDANNRNGTMINPQSSSGQGYDSESSMAFDISLSAQAPLSIETDSSLMTTVARTTTGTSRIQTAAVLTVLTDTPVVDAFRPSPYGNDKTIYRWSSVEQRLSLLPNETPVASTPVDTSYFTDTSQRPWILNGAGWTGGSLHPVDNMPSWYHREIGRFLANLSTLVLMDISSRDDLARSLVQLGIDYHGMSLVAGGTSATWQWPTIFAGAMLGDSEMANRYHTGPAWAMGRFHGHLYDVSVDQLSTVESSIVPLGYTWTGETIAWRQTTTSSDCYEQEHLHPSEWAAVSAAQGCSQPLSTRETYRQINSPALIGFVLAASALSSNSRFSKPTMYTEYARRWMAETDETADVYGTPPVDYLGGGYGTSTEAFVDEYWTEHAVEYGLT